MKEFPFRIEDRSGACPLCLASELRALPVPRRWIGAAVFSAGRGLLGLAECRSCGLVFVNPRPSREVLERFYRGHTYSCHDHNDNAATRARAEHVLERVVSATGPGCRLLDYGCGGGWLTRHALRRGFDAWGFDIGERALKNCEASGLRLVQRLEDLPQGAFDAIVMHHVLEHVPDVEATLRTVFRLLAPGGCLVVEVPNVRSLRARLSHPWLTRLAGFDERYRAYPIHLSYFSPTTLSRALGAAGFVATTVETSGLGLDELFWRGEAPGDAYDGERLARSAPARRAPAPVKRWVKGVVLGSGLGENVLAVTRRPLGAVRRAPQPCTSSSTHVPWSSTRAT